MATLNTQNYKKIYTEHILYTLKTQKPVEPKVDARFEDPVHTLSLTRYY